MTVTCVLLAAAAGAAAVGCGPPKRPAGAAGPGPTAVGPGGRAERAESPRPARAAPALAPAPATAPALARSPFAYENPFPPAAAAPATRDITIVDLANSLKREPITVGFDIDDTVLFSTPAFYAGRARYGDEYLRDPRFWTDLNTNLDAQFSAPKAVARLLMQLHQARGDRVVFISARPPGEDPPRAARAMKALLREHFRLPDDVQVVFTNLKPKTQALRDAAVTVYYGDSDADVIDALAAGTPIRPIRVLRSKYSNNGDTPHNGQMGEEVLLHSEE